MAWLKETKVAAPEPNRVKVWGGTGSVRKPYTDYNPKWDPSRVLTEALCKVTWVYRCVDAIASNAARQPVVFRKNDPWTGEEFVDDFLKKVLNKRSNPGEDSFMFRYRLSGQVLLSRFGAFIEIVRDRGGRVAELRLIPPDRVKPIPDAKKFVSMYEVQVVDEDGRPDTKKLKPEQVIWIRKPNAFDPYSAMTPLESAGVSVETDWLAKMYNRNFLLNDGRPGGMVVIKGDVMEEDKEELQSRFRGGVAMAGRITVIASTEGADFVDTAVTPRDAQYIEGRKNTKEEILMAFGVPEPVIGNAAGRTFDNAEMERLIFWMETMLPHLELICRPLDELFDEDERDDSYVSVDLGMVDVLQRMEMKRKEYHLREFDAGPISIDEYREETGREKIGGDMGRIMVLSKTKHPFMTTDGQDIELPQITTNQPDQAEIEAEARAAEQSNNQSGRTPSGAVGEQPEEDPPEREDPRPAPLANEPQKSLIDDVSTAGTLDAQIKYLDDLEIKVTSVEVGGHEVDETEWVAFKSALSDEIDSLSAVIAAEAKRFFERQRTVVDQKLRGKKMRAYTEKRKKYLASNGAVTSDSPHYVSLKAAVETIYTQDVWDKQLRDDLTPIISDAISKHAKAMADELESDQPSEVEIDALVAVQMVRLLSVNSTTRDRIGEVLTAGALVDSDVEDMAVKLDTVFDDMIETRPQTIGDTEAAAAINGGRNLAGKAATGLNKVWVSLDDAHVRPTHNESDGQEVPANDFFVVGGAKMEFPGDPNGPAEEVINCRCSLAYSNGERVFF